MSNPSTPLYVQISEELMSRLEKDISRSGQGTKKRYISEVLKAVLSEESQLVFDQSKLGELLTRKRVLDSMPISDIKRLAKVHRRTDDQMILYLVDVGMKLIESQSIVG